MGRDSTTDSRQAPEPTEVGGCSREGEGSFEELISEQSDALVFGIEQNQSKFEILIEKLAVFYVVSLVSVRQESREAA